MKKLFILTALCFISVFVFAQVPDAIKYQTVLRDNSGIILQNQVVAFRFSILSTSATGTVVYSERQQFTTNDFGLVSLNIGKGSVLSGNFTTIDWSTGVYFITVEIDIAGGTNYVVMGTSQLLSVPFAKYSNLAGKSTNDLDTSKVNELQNLSFTVATRALDISSGTGVTIPLFATTSTNAGLVPGSNTGGINIFLNGAGGWSAPGGTIYAAGTGLLINGTTLSANNTSSIWNANLLQGQPVSATPPILDLILKWNGSAWAPAADNSASYVAGTGMTLTGSTFTANNTSAIWNASKLQGNDISATAPNNGEVLGWNGAAWIPTVASGTAYAAGTGITLTANTFSHTPHSGDATGSTSITVTGLQGRTISANAPANSEVLKWNGSAWAPAADNSSTYAAGNGLTLSGNTFSHTPHTGDATGTTTLIVVALQGRSVANTVPTSGNVLGWNGSNWLPTSTGQLPTGTTGQTLMNNGTTWVANSFIYNNGTQVGIGTSAPTSTLNVNGTTQIGVNGTSLTEIITATVNMNLPAISSNSSYTQTFTVSNATLGSVVFISPQSALTDGLIIAYTRISAANTVEVKFTNTTAAAINEPAMDFYFMIIR